MAQAKGRSGRGVMFAYAPRSAIMPSVSAFALALGFVVGGGLLTEYVLSLSGDRLRASRPADMAAGVGGGMPRQPAGPERGAGPGRCVYPEGESTMLKPTLLKHTRWSREAGPPRRRRWLAAASLALVAPLGASLVIMTGA